MNRLHLIVSVMLTMLVLPLAALAQNQTGSISGMVFRDVNANGTCVNEGEPRVAANIPLELVSDDAGELIRITSNADGTYSYSTNNLGLWRVTVVPGQGWRVTSQQTVEVVLSTDNPTAEDVHFCIIEVQQSGGSGPTLPESGAVVAPPFILAAALGLALMAVGALLFIVGKK